jgi:hypothetical protein
MNNIITKRHELKYYINYIDYLNLKSRLQAIFSRDRNGDPEGYYCVRSLYFDNKSNSDYYDKMAGVEKRNKYRIRIYNLSPTPVKLEIKSKINNLIFKESMLIQACDVNNIIEVGYSCLLKYKNSVANRIYYEFKKDYYRPVVIIDYRRDAYYFELNNIRITFDRNIKKDEVNLKDLFKNKIDMSDVLNNERIIMEVKFNNAIPTWIKNLLQLERFEYCAISKYTLSRYMEN